MRRPLLLLLALVAVLVPTVDGTGAASADATAGPVGSGYWMLGSDGSVYAFGDAVLLGSPALGAAYAVDLEPTLAGDGYWIVDRRGRVHTFGAAGDFGGLAATDLVGAEEAVSLSATPSGGGYWIFTTRGRVRAFGDAVHFGDMAGTALNGPVLDSIPTPSGEGYYMVASDGGIFTFGDAEFYGSMGHTRLNAPVRSLVPDGDGAGYWLVASDGGLFSFEAPFRGSMGETPLNKPVTGMVRFGNGYLMVGEDGGIFNFSDRPFFGSLGGRPLAHAVVAVAAFGDLPAGTGTNPAAPGGHAGVGTTETTTPAAPPIPATSQPGATSTTTAPAPAAGDGSPPAGLPTEPPTHVLPCSDASGRSAVVWYHFQGPGPWAAHNPCRDEWIVMEFIGESASDPYGDALSVAPGAFFPDTDSPRLTAYEDGLEVIALEPRPLDGTRGCPEGYDLWQVGPDTGGEIRHTLKCPGADDLGWYDDDDDDVYAGPTCFGLEPDIVGTDAGETFAAPHIGRPWVILGGGGADVFRQDMYSGTVMVYFCGGDGNDAVEGHVTGFDGGNGEDSAVVYNCTLQGTEPQVTGVEAVTWLPCPDPLP